MEKDTRIGGYVAIQFNYTVCGVKSHSDLADHVLLVNANTFQTKEKVFDVFVCTAIRAEEIVGGWRLKKIKSDDNNGVTIGS